MSIAGGIAKTAENVVKMNANTMQIFSRNPRGSSYKTYAQEEVEKFQQIRKSHAFGLVLCTCAVYDESGECDGKDI